MLSEPRTSCTPSGDRERMVDAVRFFKQPDFLSASDVAGTPPQVRGAPTAGRTDPPPDNDTLVVCQISDMALAKRNISAGSRQGALLAECAGIRADELIPQWNVDELQSPELG